MDIDMHYNIKKKIVEVLGINGDDQKIGLLSELFVKKLLSFNSFAKLISNEYNLSFDIVKNQLKEFSVFDDSNKELEDKDLPLISIIIATYNRMEMLSECIHSILSQNYKNIEIIVVDDCSTDETTKMMEEKYNMPNIQYFKNEKNSGPSFSRKFGYGKSKGDYIIFCDDDDYYIDDAFFNKAIKKFEEMKDKNIAFIGANSLVKYENENSITFKPLNVEGLSSANSYLKKFQFEYYKPNSTFAAIFNRRLLEENNIIDLEEVNDSSIYMRSLFKGQIYMLTDIIGVYRVHSKNITFNISADFIIKNLVEKKNVYNIINELNLFNDSKYWLYKQVELTSTYFLGGYLPEYNEFRKIILWIDKNVDYNKTFLKTKLYKIWLIRKIAKTYKRIKNIKKS